jgi:glucose-6-phosphate isomerase
LVSVYNCGGDTSSHPESHDNSNRIIMVDLSRQRMTLETLNHLLRLATARNVHKFIRQLAWGSNDPDHPILPGHDGKKKDPTHEESASNKASSTRRHLHQHKHEPICNIPSYHLALRAPQHQGLEMLEADGTNVLPEIHRNWDRMRRFSDSMRLGKLPGITGAMIQDVVVVGRGTSVMALRFVYLALCKDEIATMGRRVGITHGRSQRRIKFLTSVDPVRAAACVADSDPAKTLVIAVALAGEEETAMATNMLQNWLLTNLGGHGRKKEVILSKHMVLVTGNEELASKYKPESTFFIPPHSRREPFTTFTSAALLPLSIVFGWPIAEEFLAGAHDMDSHFVEINPRHNLPVLLALTDIWNDCLSALHETDSTSGRLVTPFTEAFAAYPAFVAEIESQACGRKQSHSTTAPSSTAPSCSWMVMDGGLHGIYDRSLYQSSQVISSELVMTLDSQLATNASLGSDSMDDVHQAQDALMCSLFAHADSLAFGSLDRSFSPNLSFTNGDSPNSHSAGAPYSMFTDSWHESFSGNRPSTLLLCGRLDAFTCGQLVALAEHRAVIKAWIYEIDPFPKELGTTLRSKRTEMLQQNLAKMMVTGEDDDPEDKTNLNLSTKTILQHYANMYRQERVYTVDS